MSKSMNEYVEIYKKQLEKGDIQVAYEGLLKYLNNLKAYLSNNLSDKYRFGNLCRGYLDYTYFPFFNEFLRSKKLRFGIVLNHHDMRFELWLMGQNAKVQERYWELLKTTEWNQGLTAMPKYSVLEVILAEHPNFNNPDALSKEIEKNATCLVEEIMKHIAN